MGLIVFFTPATVFPKNYQVESGSLCCCCVFQWKTLTTNVPAVLQRSGEGRGERIWLNTDKMG